MKTSSRRVVVTGMGVISPLGNDLTQTWTRLIAGESAAAPVEHFTTANCRCQFAASVKFTDENFLKKHQRKYLSRASRLALSAAHGALKNSKLLKADGHCIFSWLPMSVSSTAGAMGFGESFLRGLLSKEEAKRNRFFQASRYQPQQQALDIHEIFGFQGPTTIIANACASGANAIGHASDLIRTGRHECVLTGGWEELTELLFVGFDSLQALTRECCRPFDSKRTGLMLGEAAAFLVLESEEHARKRGAEIICELTGYGHSTDIHHLTQPEPTGVALVRAMEMALKQSSRNRSDIDYLNAHGTATPLNDASECAAFTKFFGEDLKSVRISSTKAAIGHTLGAAGSIEAVFAIQSLLSGNLPPQINLREPEPALLNNLVRKAESQKSRTVMSTNLGFGGSNAVLMFSHYDA